MTNKSFKNAFSKHFSRVVNPIWATKRCDLERYHHVVNRETVVGNYSPFFHSQTKSWEGGTKDEMRISKEALFKGVSTEFKVGQDLPNLRLGGVN
jgi:hypothetical protein